MTLGELIGELGCPPAVLQHQLVMAKVRQMDAAINTLREETLMSGAMRDEFRVLLTMDRSNRFNTRYGAVLG